MDKGFVDLDFQSLNVELVAFRTTKWYNPNKAWKTKSDFYNWWNEKGTSTLWDENWRTTN